MKPFWVRPTPVSFCLVLLRSSNWQRRGSMVPKVNWLCCEANTRRRPLKPDFLLLMGVQTLRRSADRPVPSVRVRTLSCIRCPQNQNYTFLPPFPRTLSLPTTPTFQALDQSHRLATVPLLLLQSSINPQVPGLLRRRNLADVLLSVIPRPFKIRPFKIGAPKESLVTLTCLPYRLPFQLLSYRFHCIQTKRPAFFLFLSPYFFSFSEHKEHRELIPLIRSASSPFTIRCQTSSQVPSQHKRKLRSLALSPAQELLFATRFFTSSFSWIRAVCLVVQLPSPTSLFCSKKFFLGACFSLDFILCS